MASKILLDTSILISLQRGDPKTVSQFETIQESVAISRITACEFIYGSNDSKEKKINKEFVMALDVYEVNEETSKLAYKLLDIYGLKTKFSIADALIAATSISYDTKLWTHNSKHFSKISGLTLYKIV